jgi:Zn-dependent protease with chaperone function
MINTQQVQRLVERLEHESKASPDTYRLKVILLATLGYAYIFLIAIVALSSLIWALWYVAEGDFFGAIRVGLLGGLVALLLLPALWVRLPQPRGRILNTADAPKLFAMIEKIRTKAHGPRIDQVIINDVFNTAIMQIPRLGILGWHRNVLIIGLPLLQTLSRKEFAAMLAHEFGHLSGQHGMVGTWLYRIRMVWIQVYDSFNDDEGFVKLLLTRFLRWYIPYFNAYSFVLTRQDEYEADQLAARIVGPRTLADALIALAVRRRFIEDCFWQDLWRCADRNITPPFLPHSSMRTALRLGLQTAQAESWLSEELKRDTFSDDTHPCLRDRILALNTPCELPPDATHSAAQTLLGDRLAELQHAFDGLWLQHHEARWRERFHIVSSANETALSMENRDLHSLHPEELGHYALALETLGRTDEALPLLRQAADHPQGSARDALAAARILHTRNDETTIRYLELAMQRDDRLAEEATTQAGAFYEARGDTDRASAYWQRLANLQAA